MAIEFECDSCGSNATYVGRPAVYALDGIEFPCEPVTAYSRPAWCNKCKTLVDAEQLMDVDFYEQQLDEFQRSQLSESDCEFIDLTNRTALQYRKSIIDAWTIALSAARDRRSRPRCFTCGSTEISYIAGYDPESHEIASFPHPNCNGSFVPVASSFKNIDLLYLDHEGRRIVATEQGDPPKSPVGREFES